MKAIFLDAIYVQALLAHGIDIKKSKGLTNLLEKFTSNDIVIIEHQTRRLLNNPYFSNMELSNATCNNESCVLPAVETAEMDWDVFLKEGVVSPNETLNRLRNLNCTLINGTLYFFEDDEQNDNVIINALRALSTDGQLDEVLRTRFWTTFLKTC